MNKSKPFVGQVIYSLNVGNASRNVEQKLTPFVVTKIGNKYFTAKKCNDEIGDSSTQYFIDSWAEKTEYVTNSCLYSSKQEYIEEEEIHQICIMINEIFQYGRNSRNLSLESLRKIKQIILEKA